MKDREPVTTTKYKFLVIKCKMQLFIHATISSEIRLFCTRNKRNYLHNLLRLQVKLLLNKLHLYYIQYTQIYNNRQKITLIRTCSLKNQYLRSYRNKVLNRERTVTSYWFFLSSINFYLSNKSISIWKHFESQTFHQIIKSFKHINESFISFKNQSYVLEFRRFVSFKYLFFFVKTTFLFCLCVIIKTIRKLFWHRINSIIGFSST